MVELSSKSYYHRLYQDVLEYQMGMIEFSRKFLELETALLKGDNEAAAEIYKAIGGMKKPAHEKFKG